MRSCLLFLFAIGNFCLFSQSFLPVCKNFSTEDYGDDAEFRCAVSDNKGTTYFGTNYGVLIYKGEKKTIGKNWGVMILPEPDVILSLYLDTTTNRLYAGTGHDFGYFQLSAYNEAEYFSLGKKLDSYKESFETWHIYKQNSSIVFHTIAALFVYDEKERLTVLKSPQGGIFHNVFPVENGLLINALDKGWFFYNGALQPVGVSDLQPDKCYSVLPLPEKNSYQFFFRNTGVFKLQFSENKFSNIKKVSSDAFDQWLSQSQLYGAGFSADREKIIFATLINGVAIAENSNLLEPASILCILV
ncbi:MAG: hypothetical protein IAF38_18100 [Bacteroidia bacterium]|nr:hypothetical protein [Bacteroidia bacterium]